MFDRPENRENLEARDTCVRPSVHLRKDIRDTILKLLFKLFHFLKYLCYDEDGCPKMIKTSPRLIRTAM